MFPAHGVLVEAVFGVPKDSANVTSVVLVNNQEHREFIMRHLVTQVLRMFADASNGNGLYDEAQAEAVRRLYPALFVEKHSETGADSDADMDADVSGSEDDA